ncbi:AAA family ATPase [Rubellimicrobium roseum]|uniref:AAA family ATPase n=1 Tax=Rubellimicrobium roseum TaxID=687525 RepID=A0A5C4N8Z7_9RHOB|nr:AAA family ATPase [Rubellimicrobium roseum]TNC59304.1 AAA family ATPase [Rubellimicrobium roseum]
MRGELFPLVHGVRHWTDTETDLCKRLEAHLVRRRAARMSKLLELQGPPAPVEEQLCLPFGDPEFDHGEEPPQRPAAAADVQLTWHEKGRVRTRARAILAARAAKGGLAHLKEVDRQLIMPRLPGVRLGGPQTEHAADELASALADEFPWMREAVAHIWRGAQRSARDGLGLGFGPVLLDGPPGIGKTHLARRLAELAGVPLVTIDLGAGSEGFRVAGVTRGWASAAPGRPVEEILASGCGNPLVIIDELDKGGHAQGGDGYKTSAWNALLGLLEPGSARRWECPYYRLRFDLSRVCWILTANDTRWLPAPLLSRMRIVPLQRPSRGDLIGVVLREGERRGVDADSLELLAERIRRSRGELTLRHVMRALEELRTAEERGCLH